MKAVLIGILALLCVASLAWAVVGGGDVTFPIQGEGKVVFSHDSHVSLHWLSCTECHASLFTTREKHKPVTMAQMGQGKSCGACHNGTWSFSVKENCKLCHQ